MEEVGEMLFPGVGEECGCRVSDHNDSAGSACKEDERAWKNRRK